MDFSYSKTEQLFLQMIRSFAENEVKPLAAEVDEQERFPMETVEKMGKLGLMGIPIVESVRHHGRRPLGPHLLVHGSHPGERH